MTVLASRLSYADGLPLIGWREYDRLAPFTVKRLPLLRTKIQEAGGSAGKLSLIARDIAIRSKVAAAVLWAVLFRGVRTVCVGELLASGWLLQLLRLCPGVVRLAYVHGEEITTDDEYDAGCVRRRRALLAADRIIVVSRFTQRAVIDLLGRAQADRIVLIENGVDMSRFFPAPRSDSLVEHYGLAGHFVFVTVCRLLEKKGVDQALRAFARLQAEDPSLRYLIVGTGPYEAALRALAGALSIDRTVTFAGNVPDEDLVEHYQLGDVFVMPNRALPNGDTEGFGLVFLEANACGLPVIAGRDGGSTDAVRDGENGLVVDGRSVDDLAAAMRRLHRDAALRERLRDGGRRAAAAARWELRTGRLLEVCHVPPAGSADPAP